MKIKAEGDGYSAVYRAWRTDKGWCFTQQDGTYLTPGIGKPMLFDCVSELFSAIVDRRPKIRLTILCDECGKKPTDQTG